MNLPKFNETFIPILEVLSTGEVLHHRELLRRVEEKFYSDLPKELKEQQTKSGERLLENRIAWGKSYLKKGGLVRYPKRGFVEITEEGRRAKNENVNLNSFHKDLIGFYTEEKYKKSILANQDSTPQDLIDSGVQEIELAVKKELLSRLKEVDPYLFEKLVLKLLHKMGYGEYKETTKSNDGGIDGIINEDKLGLEKIYIQAKRYTENKVREPDIRNFIGAMSGDTRKGIFVTTSDFDAGARKKANDAHHVIILVDGEKLASLMYEHSVGVQLKNVYEFKSIDEDFFFEG